MFLHCSPLKRSSIALGILVGFRAVFTFLIASSKFSSSSGTPLSFLRIPCRISCLNASFSL
uniref:Uncharacterized protein n=1 Tax=Anguilla anguilla TaxID=7936 RepID=A0A0E9WJ97_ANGAN